MSALEIEPTRLRAVDTAPSGTIPSEVNGSSAVDDEADVTDVTDLFSICAEEVHVPERLIAAPTAGVFHAAPPEVVTAEGEIVHAGQVVGSIEVTDGSVTVTSAHTGFLMGLLALPGERVRVDQPLAWVRVVA